MTAKSAREEGKREAEENAIELVILEKEGNMDYFN